MNLTAPNPASMDDYAQTLARVLNRPALLNIPEAAVRTLAGEMADEMVLKSARVVPRRLEHTGYVFGGTTLEDALRHMLGRR
jgi:NAD dependent epimerase/dehydratase family enzyme